MAAVALVPAAACGGGKKTLPAPEVPEGGRRAPVAVAPALREALLGEMCADRADGRPALTVVAARQLGWVVSPEELAEVGKRVGARPFVVLSARGGRAGVFSAVGVVDQATAAPVLAGGYAGQSPCQLDDAAAAEACARAQGACGVALASLAPDGADEPPPVTTAGACLDGDALLVDVDGDGARERFTVKAFLDELNAPPAEVSGVAASAGSAAACDARFARPALVSGKDEKAFRGLDLLGVLDVDGDGRLELLMQYRYAGVRTWAIYAAERSAARLELVAELEPWAAEE